MTVIGKILVFFNLVASLATAAFIAMAYTSRTNWATAYNAAAAQVRTINANAKAEVQEAMDLVKAKEAEARKLAGEKDALVKQVESERDALKARLTEASLVQTEALPKANQNVADLTRELERRKIEVESFVARLNDRDKKISDIDRRMAELRDDATKNKQLFEAANERNRLQREQIESLKIENSQLRAQVGAGSTTAQQQSSKVLPPEDVRGTIKRIEGELATISIGSDAGVNVGNTLQVYRLNPPLHLGQIEIVAVQPQGAVGRLSGTKKTQVRVNDLVAAKILGN